MQKICAKYGDGTVLTDDHLSLLMEAMKEFIMERRSEPVGAAIRRIQEAEPSTANQLPFAIYFFQDAVNEVLRLHSIKPHWMFALDNLVRSAVQVAVTALSPDLAHHDHRPGEISPSDASTVNSVKSNKTVDSVRPNYRDQIAMLRAENARLVQDLLDGQRRYHDLLKQLLDEHRLQTAALQTLLSSSAACCVRCRRRYDQTNNNNDDDDDDDVDPRLCTWLSGLGVDRASADLILREGYRLEDVLFHVDRDDLRRLRLRGGVELKLWKAVQQHRRDQINEQLNWSNGLHDVRNLTLD